MASYRTTTLPPAGVARGVHLAAVHRAGAVVWQRAGEVVESRASWGVDVDPATLTETPDPIPGDWTRLTPAPS